MQYANNDSGQKIGPGYSGQRGWCSLCKNEMVACCGDINIDHWRHLSKTNCDNWKEAETPWHRNWKERFPAEWREKVIQQNGELHRADVQTADGIVIEFQNSFISASNIRIREGFYEYLIWIVNAKDFDRNIRKRSVVLSKLRDLEKNEKSSLSFQKAEIIDTEKRFDEKIKGYKHNIDQQRFQQEQNARKIEQWQELSLQLSTYINKLITGWLEKEYDYDDYRYYDLHKIFSDEKERIRAIRKQKIILSSQLEQPGSKLKQINGFADIELEGKKLKMVPFELLPKSQFKNIFPVLLSSLNGFFPEYITLGSETELLALTYKQKQYGFAYDVSYAVSKYQEELDNSNQQIEKLDTEVASLRLLMEPVATDWVVNEIKRLEELITEGQSREFNLEITLADAEQRKKELIDGLQLDLQSSVRDSAKKTTQQRFAVMKEHKGQYQMYWKHERKSWQYARAQLFFDTNDGFLWERLDDDGAQKIKVEDFLNLYLPKATTT